MDAYAAVLEARTAVLDGHATTEQAVGDLLAQHTPGVVRNALVMTISSYQYLAAEGLPSEQEWARAGLPVFEAMLYIARRAS